MEKISSFFTEHVRAEQGNWISVCDVSGEAAGEDVSYMSPTPKSLLISMDLASNPSLILHHHPGEASSQDLHHGNSHRRSSPERWLVPASRVNYLLLCSAQGLKVSADICLYSLLALWTPMPLFER